MTLVRRKEYTEKPKKMNEEKPPEDAVLGIISEMNDVEFGNGRGEVVAETEGEGDGVKKSADENGDDGAADIDESKENGKEKDERNNAEQADEKGSEEDFEDKLYADAVDDDELDGEDDLQEGAEDELDLKIDPRVKDTDSVLYEWDNEVVFSAGDNFRHVIPKIKEITEEEVRALTSGHSRNCPFMCIRLIASPCYILVALYHSKKILARTLRRSLRTRWAPRGLWSLHTTLLTC